MDFTFSLAIGYYWLIFFGTLTVFLLTGFYWISYSKYNFRTPKIKKNKKYKCGRFSIYVTLLSFILITLAWIINPVTFYHYDIPFIKAETITAQILKVINFFNKFFNK